MDEWVDGFVDDLMDNWVDGWLVGGRNQHTNFPAGEPKLKTSGISGLARPEHEWYIEQGP
jgi:hypothetical protein